MAGASQNQYYTMFKDLVKKIRQANTLRISNLEIKCSL